MDRSESGNILHLKAITCSQILIDINWELAML
jgi:hypothetical protein